MNFKAGTPGHDLPRTARWLRIALILACTGAIITTKWPWLRLSLSATDLAPGYRSRIGSTCLISCILLLLLTSIETRSRRAREAVRPATAFVAGVTAIAFAIEVWQGPEYSSGLKANWTAWFRCAFLCLLVATAAAVLRMPRRQQLPPNDAQ